MADRNLLLIGASVLWLRNDEVIQAKVVSLPLQKVGIRFERNGVLFTKYVDAKKLQLRFGGKKRAKETPEDSPVP